MVRVQKFTKEKVINKMANFIPSAPTASPEYDLYVRPFLDDYQITDLPFNFVNTKFVQRKLYFESDLTGSAYKKTTCGWTFDGGISYTSKDLIPVEFARGIEQCYTDLVNTIFAEGLPDGWERGTLSPEIKNKMQEKLAYAFNRNLIQTLFLGDDALSINPYKIKDGIYKSLEEGAHGTMDGTVDASVALNATSLNADNFFATMLSIYEKAPNRLKRILRSKKGDLRWIWTDSVYAAYLAYLIQKTQSSAGVIQRETIVGGMDETAFLGIPIHVVPIVDDSLATDFSVGSPAAGEFPYRVILTDPSNHTVLLDGDGFKKIHMWYEDKDDKVYAVVSALMEYKYGYGDLNLYSGW